MSVIPPYARFGAAIVAVVLAGCAKAETQPADTSVTAAPAAAAAPNMVSFNAKEFAFEGPDTVPAGLTMFHLTGGGQELHHLAIMKLIEGKTFADFEAAMKAGPPPAWAVDYGGVNPPALGETTIASEVLEPGNYAVVCFVESPDHKPHFAKGMMKSLTVKDVPGANMAEPASDVTMTLNDFSFTMSKPLAAGRQVIKVENVGPQPHEVVLVQLAPGKTIEELGNWVMDMKGPPPGKPMGGIPGVIKGKNTFFEATLTPGEYGLICFLPDKTDGKQHYKHGMLQQFKIS